MKAGMNAQEDFGHPKSVKILVILNPAGCMLTSPSGGAFICWRYILQ